MEKWRHRAQHSNKLKPKKKRRYAICTYDPRFYRHFYFKFFFDSVKEAESVGNFLSRSRPKGAVTYMLYDCEEKRMVRLFDPSGINYGTNYHLYPEY